MQRNMMIAVEAGQKYNVELWRIFAAIDAGLLISQTGFAGLTCIDEQQFIELLERHKLCRVWRRSLCLEGRRKAHE